MSGKQAAKAPFLKIILPAILGIVLARLVDVEWWVVGVGSVLCVVMAWWLWGRRGRIASAYLWISIALFFFALAEFRTPRGELPVGEQIVVAAQVMEPPIIKGRWQMTSVDVGYFRKAGETDCVLSGVAGGDGLRSDSLIGIDSSGSTRMGRDWRKVDERVLLAVDSCYHSIEVGQQIAFRGWFNPIDTTDSGYGNLMRMRGVHGRMYLTPGNLLWRSPHTSRTPLYYASRMQAVALERLSRLNVSDDAKSVITAMTAGDKRGITKEVRANYSLTGAAHLLAVSGLHVGIVFVLINILLYFTPTIKRGHIVKNVAAIVAIWLYAAMAGLTPSVVRAALMFSFAQLALATSSYRNGFNIMLGSAVLMLAINPNYATDPSFLLSYVAVMAIMLFFPPLYRAVCGGRQGMFLNQGKFRKVVNVVMSVILVGFVATLGTAPLVSYWFGTFPMVGIVLNPIVIFTAHIIVMVGVVWIIIPFDLLNPLFSWLLSTATESQNAVIGWSASFKWAALEVRLPLWGMISIYLLYVILAVWFYTRPKPTPKISLED